MPRIDDRNSTSIPCASPTAPQGDVQSPMAKIQKTALLTFLSLLLSLAPAWATSWIRIVRMVPPSPAKLTATPVSAPSSTCTSRTTVLFKFSYHLDQPSTHDASAAVNVLTPKMSPPYPGSTLGELSCAPTSTPDGGALCTRWAADGSLLPLPVNSLGNGSCWAEERWAYYPSLAHSGDYVHAARVQAIVQKYPNLHPMGGKVHVTTDARSSDTPVDYTWSVPSTLTPGLHPEKGGRATLRPVIPHIVKLKPRPKPPGPVSKSLPTSTVAMHKIGLSPRPRVMTARTLPAVQLPSGWTTVGGVLRASRPGLRLRLSGNHTLISKMARNGRLHYVLADATGRVVKRISAKESLRLLNGNTLMLQEPTAHREILLGRITTTAMRSRIRR